MMLDVENVTIAIVNPGSHPEPAHLAAGAREVGMRVTYFTSSAWAFDSFVAKLSRGRTGTLAPFRRVRSRILDNSLTTQYVKRVAAADELLFQVLRKFYRPLSGPALERRSARFRRGVARQIKKSVPMVLVAQQTAALEPFEAAPADSTKILLYPIAHHRWMKEYLSTEAHANPEWAKYLQGHDKTEDEMARLDREVQYADRIVVASTFVRDTFLQQGIPAQKISVLPLGADHADLSLRDFHIEWEPDKLRLLFVGQLNQRKGLSYLMDAFALLPDGLAQLALVGPDDLHLSRELERRVGVKVFPPVPRGELGSIYRSADVFVFPSLVEGFGLTAIEAMFCGTPCIVTTHTFGADLIENQRSGIVVPPADPEALARAIMDLANPIEREDIAERGAEIAMQYGWGRYRQASAQLLTGLLERRDE